MALIVGWQNEQGISDMRRPNPKIAPEDAQMLWEKGHQSPDADSVVTAGCELITPMFGGGVTPGEVDRDMPIRASALRGQLRFWWRLLNGAGQEPTDLFIAESALWGGISSKRPQASQVTLQVRAEPASDQQLIAKSRLESNLGSFPSYALILKPQEDPKLLNAGYGFELILRFKRTMKSQQREQVIEALRWWASFAGVGARTRRGLGAVRVTGGDVDLRPVSIEEVKSRGGRMIPGKSTGADAVKAWTKAVDALRQFRQGEEVGRNPGPGNRPGRSRWPEPDTIRRFTNRHAARLAPEHPVDGFYPRAAFGLPLVFRFKDRDDPDDEVLEPDGKDRDRMASPVILRPYFDGQQYCPVALLLPDWEKRVSMRVGFRSARAKPGPAWPEDADDRERLAKDIEPMDRRGTDVLSAFMSYFEDPTREGR